MKIKTSEELEKLSCSVIYKKVFLEKIVKKVVDKIDTICYYKQAVANKRQQRTLKKFERK